MQVEKRLVDKPLLMKMFENIPGSALG